MASKKRQARRPSSETAKVNVAVELRVQYMFKDIKTDLPLMGELKTYNTDCMAECPSELVDFMPIYVANMLLANETDVEQEPYCASKDVVTTWKAWLKRNYPDSFAGPLPDDFVIESAISCSVEDSIKDVVEDRWDDDMAVKLGAVPTVPDGHRIAARFIHVESWKLAND